MTPLQKSTTLELTINPEYVADWGSWEGLRELLQNAVDAHDLGHPMTITHRVNAAGRGVLRIANEGITMSRDALLLGTTTKANDDRTRGQFGEGFKLAWLALLRAGARIKVKSGDEIWVPQLGHSAKFGGTLIRVRCKPAQYEEKVVMSIEGIDRETWDSVKKRLLFLSPAKVSECINVDRDTILTGLDHVGMLYARGIYVGKLPGKYRWGYDLYSIELDRDRRLADPWDLQYKIRSVLERAVREQKLDIEKVYEIAANPGWKEADSINRYSGLGTELADHFKSEHGEDAVPVADISASADAEQHGLKGIVVSHTLCEALQDSMPTLEKAKEKRVLDVKHRYSAHELDDTERANISWALRLCRDQLDGVSVIIVDFIGDKICGVQNGAETQIARSQLADRKRLIGTLVHELAHRRGGEDGSVEHRENIEDIFGEIVAAHCGGE